MTHQDIANAIGSTLISNTRILSKLRKTGWLIKIDGYLIVIAFITKKTRINRYKSFGWSWKNIRQKKTLCAKGN
tara:strand:- start:534 stop:755 length:222 start_codon:yes stop_codon:yes gene_type:complete